MAHTAFPPDPFGTRRSCANESMAATPKLEPRSVKSEYGKSPMMSPATPNATFLRHIADNYAKMTSLRLIREAQEAPFEFNEPGLIPAQSGIPLRPVTQGALTKIMISAVPLLRNFCISSFAEFSELGDEDRWILFRQLLNFLIHFESELNSWKNFDGQMQKRHITLTTYFDFSDVGTERSDSKEESPAGKWIEAMFDLVRKQLVDKKSQQIRSSFELLDLDDMEIAAIVAIALWSPIQVLPSDSTLDRARDIRNSIFSQLMAHYTSRKGRPREYSRNFGDLMLLYGNIRGSVTRRREIYEMIDDTMLKTVFLHE